MKFTCLKRIWRLLFGSTNYISSLINYYYTSNLVQKRSNKIITIIITHFTNTCTILLYTEALVPRRHKTDFILTDLLLFKVQGGKKENNYKHYIFHVPFTERILGQTYGLRGGHHHTDGIQVCGEIGLTVMAVYLTVTCTKYDFIDIIHWYKIQVCKEKQNVHCIKKQYQIRMFFTTEMWLFWFFHPFQYLVT